MRYERPHRSRRYLELCRERSIVRLRLKLNMLTELAMIEIHSLEVGEEVEPHDHQLPVGQELVGHLLVSQQVDEVADNGPVNVLLHNVIGTVYHHVKIQTEIC